MTREDILVKALEQVHQDMKDGEFQPLYDLLDRLPTEEVKGYLDEAEHHEKLRWH